MHIHFLWESNPTDHLDLIHWINHHMLCDESKAFQESIQELGNRNRRVNYSLPYLRNPLLHRLDAKFRCEAQSRYNFHHHSDWDTRSFPLHGMDYELRALLQEDQTN